MAKKLSIFFIIVTLPIITIFVPFFSRLKLDKMNVYRFGLPFSFLEYRSFVSDENIIGIINKSVLKDFNLYIPNYLLDIFIYYLIFTLIKILISRLRQRKVHGDGSNAPNS